MGSALCTFAPTSAAFICGRAVAGLGASGMGSCTIAVLTRTTPLRLRPISGSVLASFETVTGMIGPMLGGFLTDRFSWRVCFGINLPLGFLAMVVFFFVFEEPSDNEDIRLPLKEKLYRLDLPGTAVFIPAIVCLLLSLQWGGAIYGWKDVRIIVLLVLFAVLMLGFAWHEHRRQDAAILPPRILKQRSILSGAWFACCCNAVFLVTEQYLSIYFQAVQGHSATKTGIFLLPVSGGLCIACLCAGTLTSAFGYYYRKLQNCINTQPRLGRKMELTQNSFPAFMFMTSILGPAVTGFLTTLRVDDNLVKAVILLGFLGFTMGLGIQAPQVAAQTVLSSKEVTMGMAIIIFGSALGPTVMITAAQSIFQARLVADVEQTAPGANTTAIEHMGLSEIRKAIGPARLKKVLLGYDKAVMQTLYLPVALACLTMLGSVTMERRSVKKKRN